MYVDQFSVRVPEGREGANGYVSMQHGKHYTLILRNQRSEPADAVVTIDGNSIGTFRVQAGRSITIERKPGDDQGRFTFYQVDSREGRSLPGMSRADQGLVSVRFIPAFPEVQATYTWNMTLTGAVVSADDYHVGSKKGISGLEEPTFCGYAPKGAKAGRTGLSGHSDQRFYNVKELDLDHAVAVTIHLRLVVIDDLPRPLGSSTRVPPPV